MHNLCNNSSNSNSHNKLKTVEECCGTVQYCTVLGVLYNCTPVGTKSISRSNLAWDRRTRRHCCHPSKKWRLILKFCKPKEQLQEVLFSKSLKCSKCCCWRYHLDFIKNLNDELDHFLTRILGSLDGAIFRGGVHLAISYTVFRNAALHGR